MNCKPGQLAYVAKLMYPFDSDSDAKGILDIRGTIVRCVKLDNEQRWILEEPVKVNVVIYGNAGVLSSRCTITAIADEYLKPWQNPGDDVEDESKAWLPPVCYGKKYERTN